MKSVLFVDSDAQIRETMAAHLAADPEQYQVRTAATGGEALQWLESDEVFLVITDARLPDMTGIELLRRVRERNPDVEVVLTSDDPGPDIEASAGKLRCLELFQKPVDPERIRRLVANQYPLHGDGFAGTLKHIQLDDLIQMCCPSGVSLTILVRRAKQEGIIFIEDGEIVHAVCEDLTGEEAFFRILGWRGGYFETLCTRRVAERTIHQSYAYLIMEAARRADEGDRDEACRAEAQTPEAACVDAERLRVLLVDDSPMMCKVLSGLLVADGDIEIVGTADNGEKALAMCAELKPDLVALDVTMPVMDGRTTLKHIMIQHPCPVVIMSNVARGGEASVMEFLTLGAVDFVSKPVRNDRIELQHRKIRERIRLAARARVGAISRPRGQAARRAADPPAAPGSDPCRSLVIVNSGVGGFVELVNLIQGIRPDTRATVIGLQTIPPAFCPALLDYVGQRSSLPVAGIEDRTPLWAGHCYLGTNGTPVGLQAASRNGCFLQTGGSVGASSSREYNYFDIFLHSVAAGFDGPVMVVLLSGADLVSNRGLKAIREGGGSILVQKLSRAVSPDTLDAVVADGIATAEAETDELIEQISGFAIPPAK